jgi:hypothetical protein
VAYETAGRSCRNPKHVACPSCVDTRIRRGWSGAWGCRASEYESSGDQERESQQGDPHGFAFRCGLPRSSWALRPVAARAGYTRRGTFPHTGAGPCYGVVRRCPNAALAAHRDRSDGALRHGNLETRRPLLSARRAGRQLRLRGGACGLVALRYLSGDPVEAPGGYVLGWTETDAIPERVPDSDRDDAILDWVTDWLGGRRSLLAAVRSQVLPEADVVLMNPLHPDAAHVPPLVTRQFSFAECLHTPPMLARYSSQRDAPT